MRFTNTFFAALLASVASVSSQATDQPQPNPCVVHWASPHQQEKIFEDLVENLYRTRNFTRAYTHFAVDYIQHNPSAMDGFNASFSAVVGLIGDPSVKVQVLRTAFSAPYGWVHSRIDGFDGAERPSAVADILRFNGTCVQEHWDVIQEMPTESVNPHPLF
ncbi:Snoal-like polyketide cyclase family protein [Favolaschia claudopus]|uniref:Snoal-like polyketide cyclase family protein n=1 Tax=Favolaschia claudopus TaxID=2862362 RepID=A0AAW0CDV8_9AGAR